MKKTRIRKKNNHNLHLDIEDIVSIVVLVIMVLAFCVKYIVVK